jgi:2-C-methyl-D-erythritol 4-phosphate cytidylyltransferase
MSATPPANHEPPAPAPPTAGVLLVAAAPAPATAEAEALLWRDLRGRPLAAWALAALTAAPGVTAVVIVARAGRAHEAQALAALSPIARAIASEPDWRASLAAGLAALPGACEWVIAHDAARPLITRATLAAGLDAARQDGAALAGEPVNDTLKRVADGRVVETLPRSRLTRLEPPLVIRRDLLVRALQAPGAVGLAGLALASGARVRVYHPDGPNPAVTSEADWAVVESLLAAREGSGGEGTARP